MIMIGYFPVENLALNALKGARGERLGVPERPHLMGILLFKVPIDTS